MNLILVLVFFLSLMFLAMIFGDRLSLFGFVDGRWLTAPFDMVARVWDMICEATDRLWCFVFDHFWWVAATVSGSIGILLVALLMVSGLSQEAAAVRVQERLVMNAGSVLDHTTVLDTDNVLTINAVADGGEVAQLIWQTPSAAFGTIPFPRQRPVVRDVPQLPLRPYREPTYAPERLTLTMEPIAPAEAWVEQKGRPARALDINRLVDRALQSLRIDDWRRFNDTRPASRNAVSRPAMREDSIYDVQDLTSQVRVFPGYAVSSSNLKVEKFAPSNPAPGDFEIQIRVTNLTEARLSGVIVRELLPKAWVPKQMQPRGAFRDFTATWLIDDLDPFQDQILSLQVESTEFGDFESFTEVSATAAVTNEARVAREARPLPPVEQERNFRERRRDPRFPDVRLVLEKPPEVVAVDDWVNVYFLIKNVGNAAAEGVTLRVTVPEGLDHHALDPDDRNREVDSKVSRLEAGISRHMILKVKPTFPGPHSAYAELLLQDVQLDIRDFVIVAGENAPAGPAPRPQPDF